MEGNVNPTEEANMKIRVEHCWGGNSNFYFRLHVPNGSGGIDRLLIEGEEWTRAVATEAKDRISHRYRINRSNIRFEH
jgi:hypothetical protein